MFETAWWAKEITAEWAAVSGAPILYLAAMVVGWIVIWRLMKAWNQRGVGNLTSRINLLVAERDGAITQREGLKNYILSLKPDAPVLAIEVAASTPEVREVVHQLAAGASIQSKADPSKDSDLITFQLPMAEARRFVALSYASGNGLSTTSSTTINFVTIGTAAASTVDAASAKFAPFISRKADFKK